MARVPARGLTVTNPLDEVTLKEAEETLTLARAFDAIRPHPTAIRTIESGFKILARTPSTLR